MAPVKKNQSKQQLEQTEKEVAEEREVKRKRGLKTLQNLLRTVEAEEARQKAVHKSQVKKAGGVSAARKKEYQVAMEQAAMRKFGIEEWKLAIKRGSNGDREVVPRREKELKDRKV
ncbi:hypothetical protein BJX70DRAFT_400853 [Aspergillus crustosus]